MEKFVESIDSGSTAFIFDGNLVEIVLLLDEFLYTRDDARKLTNGLLKPFFGGLGAGSHDLGKLDFEVVDGGLGFGDEGFADIVEEDSEKADVGDVDDVFFEFLVDLFVHFVKGVVDEILLLETVVAEDFEAGVGVSPVEIEVIVELTKESVGSVEGEFEHVVDLVLEDLVFWVFFEIPHDAKVSVIGHDPFFTDNFIPFFKSLSVRKKFSMLAPSFDDLNTFDSSLEELLEFSSENVETWNSTQPLLRKVFNSTLTILLF